MARLHCSSARTTRASRRNADVAGKAVGGGKGSAQLDQLKQYVATLPGKTNVREYIDNNQAYADLAAGRIVAVGNSLPNIAYVARQRPDTFAVVQPPFGTKVFFAYLGRKDPDSKPPYRCNQQSDHQDAWRRPSRSTAEEVVRRNHGYADNHANA